jgi:hypothetical protein
MHPGFLFLGALLYTSCVLGLCLSAFFNDMTLFINKKKKKDAPWHYIGVKTEREKIQAQAHRTHNGRNAQKHDLSLVLKHINVHQKVLKCPYHARCEI